MPSTKSSISFTCFIRSKKLGSKYCMLKNEVVCPDSLRANSLTQQPQLYSCCGGTFSIWKEVTDGRLLLEQKRIDNLQQIRRYPRTPLLVTSPCVHIEQVWNAARWMHCSKSKFLKFWITMLSPQVKLPFFSWPMLFWNGSWHLEWYGFGTCLLQD